MRQQAELLEGEGEGGAPIQFVASMWGTSELTMRCLSARNMAQFFICIENISLMQSLAASHVELHGKMGALKAGSDGRLSDSAKHVDLLTAAVHTAGVDSACFMELVVVAAAMLAPNLTSILLCCMCTDWPAYSSREEWRLLDPSVRFEAISRVEQHQILGRCSAVRLRTTPKRGKTEDPALAQSNSHAHLMEVGGREGDEVARRGSGRSPAAHHRFSGFDLVPPTGLGPGSPAAALDVVHLAGGDPASLLTSWRRGSYFGMVSRT